MHVSEVGSKNLELCKGSCSLHFCTVRIPKKTFKFDVLSHFLQMGHFQAILLMRRLGPLGANTML
jgi:hypothetical protein